MQCCLLLVSSWLLFPHGHWRAGQGTETQFPWGHCTKNSEEDEANSSSGGVCSWVVLSFFKHLFPMALKPILMIGTSPLVFILFLWKFSRGSKTFHSLTFCSLLSFEPCVLYTCVLSPLPHVPLISVPLLPAPFLPHRYLSRVHGLLVRSVPTELTPWSWVWCYGVKHGV